MWWELNNFFKWHDPNYQSGYQDGFKDCQQAVAEELKSLAKKIEKWEALTTSTSTVEVKFKIKEPK